MKLAPNADGLLDVVTDNGVVMETTVRTAILTSLMLNRRADPQDPLPYGYEGDGRAFTDDRQGWVGDVLDSKGRLVGSKLWLLAQELATEETRKRAFEYIRQALQWSLDDGYARQIDISHEWGARDRLNIFITLHMTNGDVLTLRVNYETGAVYEL